MPITDAHDRNPAKIVVRPPVRRSKPFAASPLARRTPIISKERVGGRDEVAGFLKSVATSIGGQFKKDVGTAKKVFSTYNRSLESQIPFTPQFRKRQQKERALAMRGQPVRKELALSPGLIALAIKAGQLTLRPRPGSLPSIEELDDMIKGAKGWMISPSPRRRSTSAWDDIGFETRIPFLINRKTGAIRYGERGGTHAGLKGPLPYTEEEGEALMRNIFDKHYQGHLYLPPGTEDIGGFSPVMFDLGFGPQYRLPLPENINPLSRFLAHTTRRYTDDLAAGSFRQRAEIPDLDSEAARRLLRGMRGVRSSP